MGACFLALLAISAVPGPAAAGPVHGIAAASSSPLSANVSYSDLGGSWNCGQGHQTFVFFGNVTGGVAPYQYNWTFGDGSPPSSTPTPTHTFDRFGQFVVNVSVRDSAGSWLNASVNPVWAISSACSGATDELGPLGVFGVALYGLLILAMVLGVVLLLRVRRRRPLPEPRAGGLPDGDEAPVRPFR